MQDPLTGSDVPLIDCHFPLSKPNAKKNVPFVLVSGYGTNEGACQFAMNSVELYPKQLAGGPMTNAALAAVKPIQ
jgi:hypothetical protein